MIFVKLLLLLLVFVAVDSDQQPDEYIIIATQDFFIGEESTTPSNPPDKLFLGSNAFYGHLKDSDVIARIGLSRKDYKAITIPGAKDNLFIGPDSEDNLYFYSPSRKTFVAYQFYEEPKKTPRVVKEFETDVQDKVVVIGKNHCNKDWVYLLRCSSSNNSAFIFDLKKDSIVFEYPNIKPSECFDIWGVSPNGEKIYFMEDASVDNKSKTIIHEITRLTSSRTHVKYWKYDQLAPGNNELFFGYGSGPGKDGYVVKIYLDGRRSFPGRYLLGRGDAKAIAVHQPTKECWNPKSTS